MNLRQGMWIHPCWPLEAVVGRSQESWSSKTSVQTLLTTSVDGSSIPFKDLLFWPIDHVFILSSQVEGFSLPKLPQQLLCLRVQSSNREPSHWRVSFPIHRHSSSGMILIDTSWNQSDYYTLDKTLSSWNHVRWLSITSIQTLLTTSVDASSLKLWQLPTNTNLYISPNFQKLPQCMIVVCVFRALIESFSTISFDRGPKHRATK